MQSDQRNRREFIALLSGAAASSCAWPVAAFAQVPRQTSADHLSRRKSANAFRKTAQALGVTIPPHLYIFADEVIE